MKYIVRKEMPGAKVGDILEENGGGALCKYGNTRLTSFVHKRVVRFDLIQDALDQGFIEPYEEKPKIIKDSIRELLKLDAISTGKSHIQDAIFQLEEAILKLQDNEVSDE